MLHVLGQQKPVVGFNPSAHVSKQQFQQLGCYP